MSESPVVKTGIGEAPVDGVPYSRQDAGWVPAAEGGGGVPEAPSDGTPYERQDAAWVAALPGAQGPQGDQGDPGAAGADGADSVVPGPDGPEGPVSTVPGPVGPAGADGADSVVPGPQGDPGVAGADGADSVVPGPDGAIGPDGPIGPAGADGADGVDGGGIILQGDSTVAEMNARDPALLTEGFSWVMTDAGSITSGLVQPVVVDIGDMVAAATSGSWSNFGKVEGPQGAQGIQGEQGIQGVPGADGADSVVAGPEGAPGAPGAPGDDGLDSVVPGPDGPQGIPGLDGAPGSVGPEGPTAISIDANNQAVLGTDSLVFVPLVAQVDGFFRDLKDVNVDAPSEINDLVTWDGANWVNIPRSDLPKPALNDITNVTVPTPSDGQRLAFDEINNEWVGRTSTSSLGIVALNYKWEDDGLNVQPAGRVATNNPDATLVTELYIASRGDGGGGVDYSIFFDSLEDGDWINLADRTNAAAKNSYDVTGPAVMAGDTWTIPVVFYESSGYVPADGAKLAVFMRFGQGTGDVVPEAPVDGTPYERQDAGWVAAADGVIGVGVDTIQVLTQAEYDALTPVATTLYFIAG